MFAGGISVGYSAGISASTLIYIKRENPDMAISE
jgi:hypothetical protein